MNKRKYIEWLNRHEAEKKKNREKQNKPQSLLKNNEPSVLMHHAWALGRATDKQGIVQIIKHQDANTWPMRTDWVKEACLAWRKQSFGRQITALQHLQEGYKENRAWFPKSCMVGHRGNTHKLKQEMLRLHIQKHLFTIKTARYWKRLYWKAVRSPSFEVFRTWVDKDLSNLVPTSNQPHVEQEVGLEISQHSFQPLSWYNLQSLTLLLKNTKIFQRRKKINSRVYCSSI